MSYAGGTGGGYGRTTTSASSGTYAPTRMSQTSSAGGALGSPIMSPTASMERAPSYGRTAGGTGSSTGGYSAPQQWVLEPIQGGYLLDRATGTVYTQANGWLEMVGQYRSNQVRGVWGGWGEVCVGGETSSNQF